MENEDVDVKKLDELQKILHDYIDVKLSLNKIKNITARTDITTKEIAGMTTDELNVWRFEIAQYLLYLQKEINYHKMILNWSDSALKLYIGTKAVDCAGFSFEEKKMNAMQYDNYAKKLNNLKMTAQATIDRIEFIPTKINSLIDIAKDIVWGRKREDYAENRS